MQNNLHIINLPREILGDFFVQERINVILNIYFID